MLSKKVEYGLIALLHMDAVAGPEELTSSKEIAGQHDLSVDLMGKAMQALARAGLIEAEHGAKGGYRLHGDLGDLSLGEVIEAIEGPPRLVKCRHDADECAQASGCIVRSPLLAVNEKLQAFIDGITLDQLQEDAAMEVKVSS